MTFAPNSLQDLLYLVLSICIVWATVFLCWLLFQAAKVLKNTNKIMDSIIEKLEYISDAVNFMQEKMDHVSKHMSSMTGLLGGVVEKFVVSKIASKLSSNLDKGVVEKKKKVLSKRK